MDTVVQRIVQNTNQLTHALKYLLMYELVCCWRQVKIKDRNLFDFKGWNPNTLKVPLLEPVLFYSFSVHGKNSYWIFYPTQSITVANTVYCFVDTAVEILFKNKLINSNLMSSVPNVRNCTNILMALFWYEYIHTYVQFMVCTFFLLMKNCFNNNMVISYIMN